MDFAKPILKNPEDHLMSSDMEQIVTTDMVNDAETMENELAEIEPLCI